MPVVPDRAAKHAQARMTDEDIRAFRDIVAQQKENARQRGLRQRNRFTRNREARVREAKLALRTVLGVAGAIAGMHGGKYAGGKLGNEFAGGVSGLLGGGLAGVLAGGYLGGRAGNNLADKMEQVERDTGVRVNEQETGMAARRANNLAILNMFSTQDAIRRHDRDLDSHLNFMAMHAM